MSDESIGECVQLSATQISRIRNGKAGTKGVTAARAERLLAQKRGVPGSHQMSPDVTTPSVCLDPAVLERLQAFAATAGLNPSIFLDRLLSEQGEAHARKMRGQSAQYQVEIRRAAETQLRSTLARAKATNDQMEGAERQAKEKAKTIQVGDEELPLPDPEGEQAQKAAGELGRRAKGRQ